MPYFHHFVADSMASMNNKYCTQGNNNSGVIKTVKTGYLLHFKKRLFGKAWREEFVVLYEDSSLIWFRDRDRLDPEGGIFLKDAPEMLAAGQWTSRVPAHPEFPNGCTFHHSIAVGSRHRRDKVHWFLCKSDSELVDWMSAISHTLPPPPPPPEELRNSRRNLAKLPTEVGQQQQHQLPITPPPKQPQLADKRLAMLKHQPSSPDVLLGKMGRISISGNTSSGSSGGFGSAGNQPETDLDHLTEKSRSFSTGRMNNLASSENKPRVTFREDVMAGVMMAGALTQWNATATTGLFGEDAFFGTAAGANAAIGGGGVPWDWGMGWGWAGWTPEGAMTASVPAFCGSCALEQHQAALAASSGNSYQSLTGSSSGRHEFYFDDDHELGELGETADVACDFGGDFGGF